MKEDEWESEVKARLEWAEKLKNEVWAAIFDVLEKHISEGFASDIADMFAKPIASLAVAMNYAFGYQPSEEEREEFFEPEEQ